jgi:hypothetical protein
MVLPSVYNSRYEAISKITSISHRVIQVCLWRQPLIACSQKLLIISRSNISIALRKISISSEIEVNKRVLWKILSRNNNQCLCGIMMHSIMKESQQDSWIQEMERGDGKWIRQISECSVDVSWLSSEVSILALEGDKTVIWNKKLKHSS